MKTIASVAALGCLTLLLSAGCNQNPVSPAPMGSGVAIIDLDLVAERLGSDKQIVQSIQQRQEALNQKLMELANGYIEQLNQHRNAPEGRAPTPEVQLAQYEQQANQSLGEAKRRAQQNLRMHRSQLVKQFREAVRPAARAVARERGCTVIITKQEAYLYDFTPEADISEAVAQRLRTGASQPAAESGSPE